MRRGGGAGQSPGEEPVVPEVWAQASNGHQHHLRDKKLPGRTVGQQARPEGAAGRPESRCPSSSHPGRQAWLCALLQGDACPSSWPALRPCPPAPSRGSPQATPRKPPDHSLGPKTWFHFPHSRDRGLRASRPRVRVLPSAQGWARKGTPCSESQCRSGACHLAGA